ncbi:hypothetical protein C8J56DRAFT_974756, partial [Mycena floridula]
VFLEAALSHHQTALTVKAPPNNRIYPPGPAFLFITVDSVANVGRAHRLPYQIRLW